MDRYEDVLAGIAAADDEVTLPKVVYRGTLDGPGTQLVLVFDCPVPDAHSYRSGCLFIVVDVPPEGTVVIYPAGLGAGGQTFVGRPHGEFLGVSDVSADDALSDARRRLTIR